ncbi:MAG: hypothetical protein HZC40_20505 [Chloroflexi bacterium]|nr:hypothetical protein [Chloroflexota bacterium]
MSQPSHNLDPRVVIILIVAMFGMVLAMIFGVISVGVATRLPERIVQIIPTLVAPLVAAPTPTPTPAINADDVRNVAIIATYEAQVFPEPDRSRAYRAIIWTMRNRVVAGQGIVSGYADEQNLLAKYTSFHAHRNDAPDPRAVEIAWEVLRAPTHDDDPIRGARHFVDNSYWTGANEQTGARPKIRGKYADADIQKLTDDGRFVLTIEWRAPPGHSRGPLFYGLYFFDQWPPPMPAYPPPTILPTRTFTPRATATRTTTPTFTPTFTPTLTPTRTLTPTLTVTPTLATPTLAPYP